jgi:hypothetical protein
MAKTLNIEELKAIPKDQIPAQAKTLTASDIKTLVDTLSEKDDELRYHAFLLLQAHSRLQPSVYAYWGVLEGKLDSDNSYQRSLGVMLIAENVRWDKEDKFSGAIDKYFACCTDEKFIASRQTIQGLGAVIAATGKYNGEIERRLAALDLGQYKDNQQKLLKKDIASVLKLTKK